jgi:hypothetical protein
MNLQKWQKIYVKLYLFFAHEKKNHRSSFFHGKMKIKRRISMGYSMMTPFATQTQKETMLDFLKQEFTPFGKLVEKLSFGDMNYEDYESETLPTDDLAYGPDSKIPVLGFNYGAGTDGLERDYLFSICYFMAVHGGDRKEHFPYVIYDGYEEWILYVNQKRDPKRESVEISDTGYRRLTDLVRIDDTKKLVKMMLRNMKKELELIDSAIQIELKRLSQAWRIKHGVHI